MSVVNEPQKLALIADPAVNFAQWYTDVCEQAQLFDYGAVKGTIIIKPYALKIWHYIKAYLNQQLEPRGVAEVYFPMLIPAHLLEQEVKQITGFQPELMAINQVGTKQLSEPFYLRPTSESLICHYFSRVVKSYRDLPVKYHQWCNAVRWEKNTRPFLRNSEFLWQEGHTVHASADAAQTWQRQVWNIYRNLATKLLLVPVFAGIKTTAETFAGAEQTLTIECALPNGYALQCATSHYFGQRLANIYHIQFQDPQQHQVPAFTTSWGLSTRLIGALVMTHSDRQGLVLPWNLAPVQVIIIPYNRKDAALNHYVRTVYDKIKRRFRSNINDTDRSLGFRIKAATAQGIPVQLVIGRGNLHQQTVTVGRRDLNQQVNVPVAQLLPAITKIVAQYDPHLQRQAQRRVAQNLGVVHTWAQFKTACQQHKLITTTFCGQDTCAAIIKTTTYWEARCLLGRSQAQLTCFKCQQHPAAETLFAKSY